MSVVSELLKQAERVRDNSDPALSLIMFLEQRHNPGEESLSSGWASLCFRYLQCHSATLFPEPNQGNSSRGQAKEEDESLKQFLAIIEQFYSAYLFLAHLNRCRSRQQRSPFLLKEGANELFIYLIERLGNEVVHVVKAGVSAVAQHNEFQRLLNLRDVSDLGVTSDLTEVNSELTHASETKHQQWDAGVGFAGYEAIQLEQKGAESDEERYRKLIESGDCSYSTVQSAKRYLNKQSYRQLRFASVHQIMCAAMEYLYLDRERSYFFQAGANRKKKVIDLIAQGQAFLEDQAEINLNSRSVPFMVMQEQLQHQVESWEQYGSQWENFIAEQLSQRNQSSSLLLQCLNSDEVRGVVSESQKINEVEQNLLVEKQRAQQRIQRRQHQFEAHMNQEVRRVRQSRLQEIRRARQQQQAQAPRVLVPQLKALLEQQEKAVKEYEVYRQSRSQWRVNKQRESQANQFYEAVKNLKECGNDRFFECYQSYRATVAELSQEVGKGGALGGSVFKRTCLDPANDLVESLSQAVTTGSTHQSIKIEMLELFKHNVSKAMKSLSQSQDLMQIKNLFNSNLWPQEDRQVYGKFLCDQLSQLIQQQPVGQWNHLLRDLVRIGSSVDSTLLPYFEEKLYWPSIQDVFRERWQFDSWADERACKQIIVESLDELSGLYRNLRQNASNERMDVFRKTVAGPLLTSLLATDEEQSYDNAYRVFGGFDGITSDSLQFLNEILDFPCFDWVNAHGSLEFGKTLFSCMQKHVDNAFNVGRYNDRLYNEIAGVLAHPVIGFKDRPGRAVQVVEQLSGRVPAEDCFCDVISFSSVDFKGVPEWLSRVVPVNPSRLDGFLKKENYLLLHRVTPFFVRAYTEGRLPKRDLIIIVEAYRNALLYGIKNDFLTSQEVSDFFNLTHSMNDLLGSRAVPLWTSKTASSLRLSFQGGLSDDVANFSIDDDQVLLSIKALSMVLEVNPGFISQSILTELLDRLSRAVLDHDFERSYNVMRVDEIVNVYQRMVAAVSSGESDYRSNLKMRLDVSVIHWSVEHIDETLKKVGLGLYFIKGDCRPEGQALDLQWLREVLLGLDQFIDQYGNPNRMGRESLLKALTLHESIFSFCRQRKINLNHQTSSIVSLSHFNFEAEPLSQLNFKLELASQAGRLNDLFLSPHAIQQRLLQACDQGKNYEVADLVRVCDKSEVLQGCVPHLTAVDPRDFKQVCEVFKIRHCALRSAENSSEQLQELQQCFSKILVSRLVGVDGQRHAGVDISLYLNLFSASFLVIRNKEYFDFLVLLQQLVDAQSAVRFRYPHDIVPLLNKARDAYFIRCGSMSAEQLLFCERVFSEMSQYASHLMVDPCVADFSCLTFSACMKLLEIALLKFGMQEQTKMSSNDFKKVLNRFLSRLQVLRSVDIAAVKELYESCLSLLGSDIDDVVSFDLDQWVRSRNVLQDSVNKAGGVLVKMIASEPPLYSTNATADFLLKVRQKMVASILNSQQGDIDSSFYKLLDWFNSIVEMGFDIDVSIIDREMVSKIKQFSACVLNIPDQVQAFDALQSSLGQAETSFIIECMCSSPLYSQRIEPALSQVLNEVVVSGTGRIDVGRLGRYGSFLKAIPAPVLGDIFSKKLRDYDRMITHRLEQYEKTRPQSPKSVRDDVNSFFDGDPLVVRLRHTLNQVSVVQEQLSAGLDFESLQLYYSVVFPTNSFDYLPFSCRHGFMDKARGHSRQLQSTSSLLFKRSGQSPAPPRLRSLSCKPDMLFGRSALSLSDRCYYTRAEREKVKESKRQVEQVIDGLTVLGLA